MITLELYENDVSRLSDLLAAEIAEVERFHERFPQVAVLGENSYLSDLKDLYKRIQDEQHKRDAVMRVCPKCDYTWRGFVGEFKKREEPTTCLNAKCAGAKLEWKLVRL